VSTEEDDEKNDDILCPLILKSASSSVAAVDVIITFTNDEGKPLGIDQYSSTPSSASRPYESCHRSFDLVNGCRLKTSIDDAWAEAYTSSNSGRLHKDSMTGKLKRVTPSVPLTVQGSCTPGYHIGRHNLS
jgi:hypothetical protein